jgi:hypothetical protein
MRAIDFSHKNIPNESFWRKNFSEKMAYFSENFGIFGEKS